MAQLITNSQELTAHFKRLMNTYNHFLWTTAWADYDFEVSEYLTRKKSKIRKICVGLKFYGTSPDFLRTFYRHPGVRFIDQTTGTYHPKLYLFQDSKNHWEAIIGSANFTASAFTQNTETCVLISSKDKNAIELYREISEFINLIWKKGKVIDASYIKSYTERKSKIKELIPPLPKKGIEQPVFEKDWETYLQELKQEDYKSRIKLIDWTNEQFKKYGSLKNMPLSTRQSVAGFGKGEQSVTIGCFGTTGTRGYFKQTVNTSPRTIDIALSFIPKKGPVSKDDYKKFIKAFSKVSKEKELACATRMLCLWRPDYFVSFNGQNEEALSNELRIKKSSVSLDSYWDTIVEPLLQGSWSEAAEVKSLTDRKIFNNRVALLDCIYYKWGNKDL